MSVQWIAILPHNNNNINNFDISIVFASGSSRFTSYNISTWYNPLVRADCARNTHSHLLYTYTVVRDALLVVFGIYWYCSNWETYHGNIPVVSPEESQQRRWRATLSKLALMNRRQLMLLEPGGEGGGTDLKRKVKTGKPFSFLWDFYRKISENYLLE